RLLSTETAARARDFQDAYLDQHARLESRARLFRVLLYLASVLLLAHLGYLFLRLRANARALAERSAALSDRLAFESLVTEISADFIDLPVDRLDDGIVRALGRLGEHMGVDRAYLLLLGGGGRDVSRTYDWARAAADPPGDRARDLLAAFERLEEDGTAHVPSVGQLPPGPERTALESRGVRSWLCLRVGLAGRRLGLLGFDATRAEKQWSADDAALLRTVAEILAHALERRRGEAERDALETQLRHAQRMEAIGTLAGGIAHDFNNVLGAILGHAELAAAKLPRSSRPRRHIEQVRQAGLRAKGVVDQILAFGRRTDREHRPVRMRPVVEEAVALLSASLPRTVAIRPTFRDDGAAVPGDATQLQQVIVNLCTNAAQAMDGRGTVELVLDTVEVAGERILSHGTLAEGRHVRLAVTDTGHGMDEATMARIFEPFFTTKGPGAGTGLGLSTVHGIVADHGGALNVQSRPGAGSTFEVYLARAEASPAADGRAGEPPPAGRGETILLVDDERSLVRLGEEMLAALGYEPVGFQSGAEALAAFEADPRRFDLLLADEVMPGMTGSQLAAAVHRVRPDLPIVLMTGHREPAGPDRLRAAGIREVLEKPLLSADIAASLARHLNPRGTRPSTR
ncbi:MAG TPA: ATP-binding protein, partial [Thermodesulfobacteriota bacterium]